VAIDINSPIGWRDIAQLVRNSVLLKSLTPEQIDGLVKYIRELGK
jgi:hypothetical protein